MDKKHFIIIGNGPAGNKPMSLPDLIAGKIDREDLFSASADLYEEKRVKLRLNQRVVDLDLKKRQLLLDHKEVITFTGLIIAVGGKPRIPEPVAEFKNLMLTLKTVSDAELWIKRLSSIDSVLIIGGDLTSFSIAKMLFGLNKKIFFILTKEAFWPLRRVEEAFKTVSENLFSRGVKVVSGRVKTIIRHSETDFEVITDEGKTRTGLVGAFFGLVPDVNFLVGSGLRIDRGILVDEFLNTGFEGVYAAGDCAQVYHPGLKDYWVSIGFDNAEKMGRIAALNLLGGTEKAQAEPSDIFSDRGVLANTSWWMEL
jgi:NADPH-dependent 2,4-dienoyl-CoA reductase/sulfur reductase-like enzyme